MKQFRLKELADIADKCGVEFVNVSSVVLQYALPKVPGLEWVDDYKAKVFLTLRCVNWDKDINKRKYIVGSVYPSLEKGWTGYECGYYANKDMELEVQKVEKDIEGFCRKMLQKTINKAKLLRKNEIKKAGAKYVMA